VVGAQRFLQRVWRLLVDEQTGESLVDDAELDAATLHAVHTTIDGVRGDMENLRFNTAVAKLIELTNHLTKVGVSSRAAVEPLVLMLAPLRPTWPKSCGRASGTPSR
jgi:leucyl-tRNA synthetase